MRKLLIALLLLFSLTALAMSQAARGGGTIRAGGTVKAGAAAAGGASSLLTDLVASWKFDESSGDAADASGGGNTLTNNNTVTFSTGVVNNAAYFTAASTQYFEMASNASVQSGDVNMTICASVHLTDKSTYRMFITKDDTGASREYILYYDVDTDRLAFACPGTAFATVTASSLGSPSLNTWYRVCGWQDATNDLIGIAVNDGTVNTAPELGPFAAAGSSAFRVGARVTAGASHHDGRIDNVSIWKKVLTATERTCDYGGGTPPQHPFTGVCL